MRVALIVADSVRADAPSYAGGEARTPTLDRFASQSATFSRAWSPAPWTVPSLSSLLTSRHPLRLGAYRWEHPLPEASLFRSFADAGCRVASFVFDPDWLFVASPEACVQGSSQRFKEMLAWLRGCDDQDLFVFIHLWGTHVPYIDRPMSTAAWKQVTDRLLQAWRAAPDLARPKVRALYHRAIERFSEVTLPGILEALLSSSRPEDTVVALTADHGESFDASPFSVFDLHGNHLRDEVLAVPLVLWAPGRIAASRRGECSTLDIAPTLLQLAGLPPLHGAEGCVVDEAKEPVSLSCAMRDFVTAGSPPPAAPQELWTRLAWRSYPWKLTWEVATGERLVFHLPDEQTALEPGSGEPVEGWTAIERAWQSATCAPPPDLALARLRRLGYVE